jgi:hypothetical protein
MIFGLIRFAIWLAGVAVVSYVVLLSLGYEVNWSYWKEQRTTCEAMVRQCQNDLIRTGIEGAKEKCRFQCIDPKLFIKKK